MFDSSKYDKYAEIYNKISDSELALEQLMYDTYDADESKYESVEAKFEAMMHCSVKEQTLRDVLYGYDDQLRKMIKEDFADYAPDAIRPGDFVKAHVVAPNQEDYDEYYRISLGHFSSEDGDIQAMYGCGIKLVAPYDLIGQHLMGKRAGDSFTYTVQNCTYNGIILKVN